MIKKLTVGITASLIVFVLPAWLLQPDALHFSKLWVLVGIGLLASITQPAYSPIDRNAPPDDRGTATQLVWTVYTALILGVIEGFTWRYPLSMNWDSFSILMLIFAVSGAMLRAWAVSELGSFFSWHVRVQPEQKVINTGPYKIVRHPGYTGAWILYVCSLLFIHAWVVSALCGVFLLAGFLRRIRYEEELMLDSFGEQYSSYCLSVKRLVPVLW